MKRTGPNLDVVAIVMARCSGHCEICGTYLAGDRGRYWSIHHRRPRGMGGTQRPETNQPANLLAVCGSATTGCHSEIESWRRRSTNHGLLVPQSKTPADVPVLLRYGLVCLNDTGTWTPVEGAA